MADDTEFMCGRGRFVWAGESGYLLRSVASALVILGAILLFNAVLLIISTALMLSVKAGT